MSAKAATLTLQSTQAAIKRSAKQARVSRDKKSQKTLNPLKPSSKPARVNPRKQFVPQPKSIAFEQFVAANKTIAPNVLQSNLIGFANSVVRAKRNDLALKGKSKQEAETHFKTIQNHYDAVKDSISKRGAPQDTQTVYNNWLQISRAVAHFFATGKKRDNGTQTITDADREAFQNALKKMATFDPVYKTLFTDMSVQQHNGRVLAAPFVDTCCCGDCP